MKIEVYWNLHKKLYSIRESGIVVDHMPALAITNATFAVQPAGRAKVVKEQRKNVHAFVRGYRQPMLMSLDKDELVAVTYNPYRHESFIIKYTEEPVYEARFVFLTSSETRPIIQAII